MSIHHTFFNFLWARRLAETRDKIEKEKNSYLQDVMKEIEAVIAVLTNIFLPRAVHVETEEEVVAGNDALFQQLDVAALLALQIGGVRQAVLHLLHTFHGYLAPTAVLDVRDVNFHRVVVVHPNLTQVSVAPFVPLAAERRGLPGAFAVFPE